MRESSIPSANTPQGVLLFAHGSAMSAWREPFDQIFNQLRLSNPHIPCRLGFLERTMPDFRGAMMALLTDINAHHQEQRQKMEANINVVPLFLAHSVHTARDIPRLIGEILDDYPLLNISIAPSLLQDETIFTAIKQTLQHLYFKPST